MDELLDTVIETENIHQASRIWITTEVHPKFPISLLQVHKCILQIPIPNSQIHSLSDKHQVH